MSLAEKFSTILSRHEELASLMSQGGLSGEEFAKMSMEYAELDPVVAAINELQEAQQEREGLEEMLSDPEMKEMAYEEKRALDEKIPALEKKSNWR